MPPYLSKMTRLTLRWIEAGNYETGIAEKAELLPSLEGDNLPAVIEMKATLTRIQGLVF